MQQKRWYQTKEAGTSATYWPGDFTHALNVLASGSEFWKTEMNQTSPIVDLPCSNNLLIFFFTDFHVRGLECNLGSTSTNPVLHESHPLLSSIILNHSLSSSRTPSAPHIHPQWPPWLFSSSLWYMCPCCDSFPPTVTLMLVTLPAPPPGADRRAVIDG